MPRSFFALAKPNGNLTAAGSTYRCSDIDTGLKMYTLKRLFVVLMIVASHACTSLPEVKDKQSSNALALTTDSLLGELAGAVAKPQPDLSGILLLDSGRQAFLQRANLIETAQRSIDAQYYIWNSDASGRYLARRLYLAAERGVRVRVLLDDINIQGRDPLLAQLDLHSNIEIRIFNPSSVRKGPTKGLAFMANFERMNRRMHNKTFIADSAVAIVGGRNIGDEYFDLHPEKNHRDRDVLVVGEVVPDVSSNFDNYWNSEWSYPIASLIDEKNNHGEYASLSEIEWQAAVDRVQAIHNPLVEPKQVERAINNTIDSLIWSAANLVYDPVVDDMSEDTDQPKATALALLKLVEQSQSEILVESAYFVLGKSELTMLDTLNEKGVRVAALTNSLASNDLTTNHAAYARWRSEKLEHGMDLFELRPDAQACEKWIQGGDFCKRGKVSLHTKSAVFDRAVVFIGSFNVNLRSIYLNGETILIIRSPELADQVAKDIENAMRAENSWQVTRNDKGKLQWASNSEKVWKHEPEVNWWRRFKSGFIAWLPIEKYL
jgi:putative cardiolipin synthase